MKSVNLSLDEPVRLRMNGYLHPKSCAMDGTPLAMSRPAVIVCPGGAYQMRAEAEGDPVAMALAARGFQAFTLRYGVGADARYPNPVRQLAAAVSYLRTHAEEWDIAPEKIAVMGFSAGGHLAACLGTLFEEPEIASRFPVSVRPDALALFYPCILADTEAMGELFSLLGEGEALQKLSCEKRVNEKTPPTFLAATYADGLVPVEHSLAFANALAAYNRPFELHIFEKGNHCELNAASPAIHGDAGLERNAQRGFALCCDWLLATLGAPNVSGGFPAGPRAQLGATFLRKREKM